MEEKEEEQVELRQKFLSLVQQLHGEMFKDKSDHENFMSLYACALNMIGHLTLHTDDKDALLSCFIEDVKKNFIDKKEQKLE